MRQRWDSVGGLFYLYKAIWREECYHGFALSKEADNRSGKTVMPLNGCLAGLSIPTSMWPTSCHLWLGLSYQILAKNHDNDIISMICYLDIFILYQNTMLSVKFCLVCVFTFFVNKSHLKYKSRESQSYKNKTHAILDCDASDDKT